MVIRSLTIFVDLVLLFVYFQFVFVFLYFLIHIFISWKQFVNVFFISRSSSQQAAEERHEGESYCLSRRKGDQHMLLWTVLCFLKFLALLFHVGQVIKLHLCCDVIIRVRCSVFSFNNRNSATSHATVDMHYVLCGQTDEQKEETD